MVKNIKYKNPKLFLNAISHIIFEITINNEENAPPINIFKFINQLFINPLFGGFNCL